MIKKWFFPFERILIKEEYELLETKLNHFFDSWKAHGVPLKGKFELYKNQILVLQILEISELPSGCSIDDMKKNVSQITDLIGVKIFDSNLVVYMSNDSLKALKRTEVKDFYNENVINENTLVLDVNSMALDKESNLDNLLIPLKNSWVSYYLT